jgi:hypothetical protein
VLVAIRFQQIARYWRRQMPRLERLALLAVVCFALAACPVAFCERKWLEDWQEAREAKAYESLLGQAELQRFRGLEAARKQAEQERARRREELARLRAAHARRIEDQARFRAERQRRAREAEEARAMHANECTYTGPRGR